MKLFPNRARPGALLFAALALFALGAQPARAGDAYVVISGGGNPNGNNYSQYLQARAYVTYLEKHYPKKSIWVFFGAGNVTGQKPLLSDVIQTETDDKGRKRTFWIPGALPGNRPARRETLARAFREEILPTVRDGGTLYLFVGDHGSPSGTQMEIDDFAESVITLWSWDRDPTHPFGWRSYANPTETLGVAELRNWLSAGLGRGRVVFAMSQCYSGGFHYLGVPREVAPNPAWFKRTPGWVAAVNETKRMPLAAGFTATDDQSIASGCTPDVAADRWAGYERYLAENLVGLDLFTLKPGTQPARRSFHDAHIEAVLVDQTLDKPRSTSEQYLQVWARTIATRLEKDADVKDGIKPLLENFRHTMEGVEPQVADPAFKQRQEQFRRFVERMIKENPELKDLAGAKQEELETAMKSADGAEMQMQVQMLGRGQGKGGKGGKGDKSGKADADEPFEMFLEPQVAYQLWNQKIAVAWQKALEAGEIKNLSPAVIAFEKDMVKTEVARGASQPRSMAKGQGLNPGFIEYYHAGYANPATLDKERARQIDDWTRRRQRTIVDWAKKSASDKVRVAAEAFELSMPPGELDPDKPDPQPMTDEDGKKPARPSRKVAAERIYFYRQVLAAWQFLLAVDEKPALERVAALTQLENTALPAGR